MMYLLSLQLLDLVTRRQKVLVLPFYNMIYKHISFADGVPQLNSSLLTNGSRMAKRNTVHKNKSNDQSE